MAKIVETTIKDIKHRWYTKVISCKALNKGHTVADYGFFYDTESSKDIRNAVEVRSVAFTAVSDKDIFKQAYEAMSGLEEFQCAADC